MAPLPSPGAVDEMARMCGERHGELVSGGCDPGVAEDRVFDCLRAAIGEIDRPYDERDMMFCARLRGVAEREGVSS